MLRKVLDRVEDTKHILLFLGLDPAIDKMIEQRLKFPSRKQKGKRKG
jgi:hypothetical protein